MSQFNKTSERLDKLDKSASPNLPPNSPGSARPSTKLRAPEQRLPRPVAAVPAYDEGGHRFGDHLRPEAASAAAPKTRT